MALSQFSDTGLDCRHSTSSNDRFPRPDTSKAGTQKPLVLVTGADGLLGSNLVRELFKRDYAVRVLIHPASLAVTLADQPVERHPCDLLGEGRKLQEAVKGCDHVIHAAAITDFWEDRDLTFRVNLEGTERILDACLKEKIKRFVFVGSASSFRFGVIERSVNEENGFPEVYEKIPYMRSKFEAMKLVKQYAREKRLDAVIVAPTFMLGNFDSRPSSGETIRCFINNDMKVTSPGGRNFVHVRDAAEATVNALEKGKTGESYILGGQNMTFLEFFTKVAEIAGKKPPQKIIPAAGLRIGGALGSAYARITGKKVLLNGTLATCSCTKAFYSWDKAKKELGMKHTPIELAIKDSIRSLKHYGFLER